MKKILIFNLVLFITPLIAGLYGILHDQLTYTISPEYYTKFKFIQFGLAVWDSETILTAPRLAVTKVGFMATWWTGIFIGLALASTGLIHKDSNTMLKEVSKAVLITLVITFITGLVGLAYGKFFLAQTGVSWWLPESLNDKESFIAVGSMHNFSYLGGFIGLVTGIIYQVRRKRKSFVSPSGKLE